MLYLGKTAEKWVNYPFEDFHFTHFKDSPGTVSTYANGIDYFVLGTFVHTQLSFSLYLKGVML